MPGEEASNPPVLRPAVSKMGACCSIETSDRPDPRFGRQPSSRERQRPPPSEQARADRYRVGKAADTIGNAAPSGTGTGSKGSFSQPRGGSVPLDALPDAADCARDKLISGDIPEGARHPNPGIGSEGKASDIEGLASAAGPSPSPGLQYTGPPVEAGEGSAATQDGQALVPAVMPSNRGSVGVGKTASDMGLEAKGMDAQADVPSRQTKVDATSTTAPIVIAPTTALPSALSDNDSDSSTPNRSANEITSPSDSEEAAIAAQARAVRTKPRAKAKPADYDGHLKDTAQINALLKLVARLPKQEVATGQSVEKPKRGAVRNAVGSREKIVVDS